MYYERYLSSSIKKASSAFPALLLTGPRQVGKTTLLEHCLEGERTIITLDDPILRAAAKNDPALFFKTYSPPLLIDEVQYVPELFPYIKMICDKEKKPGLFWLTGSHLFNLMKNVSESLAGRAAVLNLQGLSQGEKNKITGGKPFELSFELRNNSPILTPGDLYQTIWRGSFPQIYANPGMDWKLFYDSYLSTYIEKDIRLFGRIEDEQSFLLFIRIIAARSGQLLNYSNIASDAGISVNTAKAWVSLLLTSGLIFLLYPYSGNLFSRAVKTPKLYFWDTGLMSYLAGVDSAGSLANGMLAGSALETYAVTEILKSYQHNGERVNAWFYRDKEQREIDLLIEKSGALFPIEIKRTASPGIKDIRHFEVLDKPGVKRGLGAVICLVDKPVPLRQDAVALPVGYL
jgi:predicted AAA+ superfamily ATPase